MSIMKKKRKKISVNISLLSILAFLARLMLLLQYPLHPHLPPRHTLLTLPPLISHQRTSYRILLRLQMHQRHTPHLISPQVMLFPRNNTSPLLFSAFCPLVRGPSAGAGIPHTRADPDTPPPLRWHTQMTLPHTRSMLPQTRHQIKSHNYYHQHCLPRSHHLPHHPFPRVPLHLCHLLPLRKDRV